MRTISTALATATITALLAAAPAQSADDSRPPSRPASVMVYGNSNNHEARVGWFEPTRTGSHPILRYVIRWKRERLVVPARQHEVNLGVLDPGRYVFKVKAVSRAGSSPWTRSQAAYYR